MEKKGLTHKFWALDHFKYWKLTQLCKPCIQISFIPTMLLLSICQKTSQETLYQWSRILSNVNARRIVVIGLVPIHCAPLYLWQHRSENGACIEEINNTIIQLDTLTWDTSSKSSTWRCPILVHWTLKNTNMILQDIHWNSKQIT